MPVTANGEVKRSNQPVERPLAFRSLQPCDLSKCTRGEILDYFENTFDLNEYIFTAIVDEKHFYKCPDRLRLPLIFYLCHTATLYINKLILAGLIDKRVNRHFEALFETGVDEMSWDDTENYRMGGSFKWPALKEVMEYRQLVREVVVAVIQTAPLELPITMDHPWWALFMGMEHERIHIETSSVLLRQLPVEFLRRPKNWKYGPISAAEGAGPNNFVSVPAGTVVLGKPVDFPSYGWDNEYGRMDVSVPEFEATRYLVTNREFLEFVSDGGYKRKDLWTAEGWQWVQFRQARHPTFWVCVERCKSGCGADLSDCTHCSLTVDGRATEEVQYKYRAIYDVMEMPWEWPVDVNYHEAKAFCTWKGPEYRLPTEAEHHRMRGDLPPSVDTSCDPIYSSTPSANYNLQYGSSTPVNLYPANAMGFHDVYGNVWEWVEDHFNGFPGFKTNFLYDDFSSPCFDGRHNMILGGSWISTGDEASRFARYSFRRHFFQHLGFRVVRSSQATPVHLCQAEVFVPGTGVPDNPIAVPGVEAEEVCVVSCNRQYEYDQLDKLEAALQSQYDQPERYAVPLVQLVEGAVERYGGRKRSAVNFGCSTGLSAFLLTHIFDEVVGVDFAGRFIDAAQQLQRGQAIEYGSPTRLAEAPRLPGVDPGKVVFKQLTWIPNEMEGYDVILFESPERLMEPKAWLMKLWECLGPGGLAIVAGTTQWNGSLVDTFIGKRFQLLEELTVGGRSVTVWQLRA